VRPSNKAKKSRKKPPQKAATSVDKTRRTRKKMFSKIFVFGAIFSALPVFRDVDGHVSLTFPPARKYDLDFLDTFR
jgi:hypothetical protein